MAGGAETPHIAAPPAIASACAQTQFGAKMAASKAWPFHAVADGETVSSKFAIVEKAHTCPVAAGH